MRSTLFGLLVATTLTSIFFWFNRDESLSLPSCHSISHQISNPRFKISKTNGIATDKQTGLTWYRCNAGQRFSNNECQGKSLTFNWKEAIRFPVEVSNKTGNKWRLPTKEEMLSLKLDRCRNPAINTNIFPGIEVANYWTSSPSRRGALFGCSFYSYEGRVSCLMRKEKSFPLMLVLSE